MAGKPTVGVTGPDRGGWMAWVMTALALRRCGARPRRVTATRPCDPAELDGLVIGGGTDVDPLHYGESRPDTLSSAQGNSLVEWLVSLVLGVSRALFAAHRREDYDPERDQLEQHLIQYALYNNLPVLGICRGAQLMNVTLGGTLHQQIEHFYSEETGNIRSVLPRKSVTIASESRLKATLQTASCRVNALHDQSIKDLGDQVMVCAREGNGVVQAIERRGHPYFIGVQWHPEYMPQSQVQQHLFRDLVQVAAQPHLRTAT